ncbi:MAG: hypothetical protein WCP45_04265, partial [Verrucomicrobiota bacterium]
ELPPNQPNAAGILITLDAASKTAAMSFGYLLDPFLEETDTFDCLWRAHSRWLEGRYADGMVKAIEQLAIVLRKRSRQARRNPAGFERKLLPPAHGKTPQRHAETAKAITPNPAQPPP